MEQKSKLNELIEKPPVRFAILAMLGPSYVWCSEFIGSGEVILATRSGAILGPSITWVIVIGIFLGNGVMWGNVPGV